MDEGNGYNVSYTTDVDMDKDQLESHQPEPVVHIIIRYFSVGHDEYWSFAATDKG